MKDSRRMFLFGAGYCAQALRRRLGDGWSVAGTARTAAGRADLERQGISALVFDGTAQVSPSTPIAEATHALISIPPGADGDPVLRHHAGDLAGCEWVGYLSTTGVYGDRGGGWVDEDSDLRPVSARSRRRADAERAWLDWGGASGVPVQVFRLAGIYGPGRSPIDQVRAGTAKRIRKPGHLFSRIHVDDVAAVLAASIDRPRGGAVYNVCDDAPAAPADVVAHACELLGIAPPPEIPFEAAGLSPMARSFWADDRRVRNDRIKEELGVRLAYPDYRRGLEAVLRETDRSIRRS